MSLEDVRTANFYSLIHQLVAASPKSPALQRRNRERHAFNGVCQIAPLQGSESPAEGDFVAVRCQDLNQEGFSFLLSERPDSTSLLAALGEPPARVFMAAEVCQCHEVWTWPWGEIEPIPASASDAPLPRRRGAEPGRAFQVGCRFVRRVTR